jgi:alkylhydroperoxidase/carboxymuconolactone decarboxylase family protein YurZ
MTIETRCADQKDGFEQLVDVLGSHAHELHRLRALRNDVFREGALSRKHKWLIALAMAVGERHDQVIGYYVDNALHSGASRQEILEAVSVSVLMGADLSVLSGAEAMAAVAQAQARELGVERGEEKQVIGFEKSVSVND